MSLRSWLRAEIVRVRVLEHDIAVKRVHLTTLILAVAVAAAVAFTGGLFTGRYVYPYRVLPRPPLPPGQAAPPSHCAHVLGGCLPRPREQNAADITATNQGPDLSNNDPVYGDGAWAGIARRSAFAVFKVSEGTGFIDSTAAPMTSYARRHGLVVGGYDFLHVCGDDAASEARLFVSRLRADGLIGPRTLPPVADAEYGGSGCNARSWLLTWAQTVRAQTGRWPMIYTGAWWWQPHVGCWWPGSLAWISGYGVAYPYMPCGRSQLDMWQFTDAGFNGATTSDMSVWRDGVTAFRAATLQQRLVCFGRHARARNRTCIRLRRRAASLLRADLATSRALRAVRRGLRANRCRRPYRRDVCIDLGREIAPVLIQRQRWFAARLRALVGSYS